MARILPVLALLALLASGCLGTEGRRAQELLEQSQAATAQVHSMSFQADATVTVDGETHTVSVDGAASYQDGEPASQIVRVHGEGIDAAMLVRGGRMWAERNGRWELIGPVPRTGAPTIGPDLFRPLAEAIKDVHVEEGRVVDGEPTSTVTATIDTGKLLSGAFDSAGLKSLGLSDPLKEVEDALDDMRVVLVFADDTHLLKAAMVTLGFHAEGHAATLELGLRVTSVDRPVEIPPAPAVSG